jgi:4-amino-4-deoxy-L-arabinose transferase-like glycosyltransferase
LQLFVDLGSCFLCASVALRLFGERAARMAFVLAALCPFLANYSAAVLAETLEIFFTALAFDAVFRAWDKGALRDWFLCGGACAAAVLLRPDGAILPVVISLNVIWHIVFRNRSGDRSKLLRALLVLSVASVLPVVPWAIRNWHTFHRFQPLAPRYANEEAEVVPMGFNHWVKTWIVDYVSTEEVYWAVPGTPLDVETLPSRAFDNEQQRVETGQLIADYNQVLHVTPALNQRFEALAQERTRTHPLRTYVELPLLRILDMWSRPRTEILPSDTRWWEFNDDPKWAVVAVSFGVLGLSYLVCGATGWLRTRQIPGTGVLVSFVVLRSAFLGTLENPEPRYTLEMYPIVIIFAAAALVWRPGQPSRS